MSRSLLPLWPHLRTEVPLDENVRESEQFSQMNTIHHQFVNMIIIIKTLLEEMGRIIISDLSYIRREEMKTVLDILESFLVPLFDHHSTDVWKRRDKKTLRISIEKIRYKIHEARDKYNFARSIERQSYNEAKIYKLINDLCGTIFQTINFIVEPKLKTTEAGRIEMLTPLKQLTSIETVLLLHPALTKCSEKFLSSKFSLVYTRIHQIQTGKL